jgi:hypothetical protein
MATLAKADRLNADFDRSADVLYLALGKPRPDEGEDREGGVVLRFGVPDDRPSGVTIIGYVQSGWSENIGDLAEIVSRHLSVRPADVVEAVRAAEGRA